jgi:predicted PurR-regulated permease PerM
MAKTVVSERTLYVGIGLVFALLVGGYFVYEIGGVVLAFLLSVLFSIIFGAPVNYLARRGLPRAWGVLAMLATLVVVLWLFALALAPAIAEQSRQLAQDLPVLVEEALALVNRVRGFFGLRTPIGPDTESLSNVGRELLTGSAVSTAAGVGITVAAVGSLGLVVAISTVYLIIQPEPWVNGFVSLFPAGWRQRVRELLGMMYHTIQRWFLGQLAAMTFIGVFWAVALSVIGVPFALLLGIFSGLISFVPFVGAIVSVVVPIVLALVSDPITAVWVVLAFVVIQQLEGNVLQPIVMSQAVDLHPAMVVFALVVMGTLFGFVGIFLAVPLAAAVQVLVRELWVKRMDRMGTDPDPPAQKPDKRDPPGFVRRAFKALRRSSHKDPAP